MHIHGIKYTFKILDLNKYSDDLKYGRFNWPINFKTIGKKMPLDRDKDKILAREIHFDRLLSIIKETDWSLSPLYKIFQEHGRWKHVDTSIYSEVELKYLHSSLNNMIQETAANYDEF